MRALKRREEQSIHKRALVPSLLSLFCDTTSCRVEHSCLVEHTTTNNKSTCRRIRPTASQLRAQNARSRTSLDVCSSHCDSQGAFHSPACRSPNQRAALNAYLQRREGLKRSTVHHVDNCLSALLRRQISSSLASPSSLYLPTINILSAYRSLMARMKAHVGSNAFTACLWHRLHEAANFGKHNEASESSAGSSAAPALTPRPLSYHLLSSHYVVESDTNEYKIGVASSSQLTRAQ
jgi:hypothetical protein